MINKRRYLNRSKNNYTNRNFENPFYKKNKIINIGLTLRAKILLILVGLILCLLLWLIFFFSYWRITEINIEGLERMSPQEVVGIVNDKLSEKYLYIISKNNSLFLRESEIENILTSRYHFEEINVEKQIPHKLNILIKERPFVFVWKEGDSYYYSDINGSLMEEVDVTTLDYGKYPIIVNMSSRGLKDNVAQVDQSYIDFIINLKNIIDEQGIGFELEEFIVSNEIDTIQLVVKNGPLIKFNTKDEIAKQLDKLIVVKDEKLKEDFFNKNYIDLRYGDKIYFQ